MRPSVVVLQWFQGVWEGGEMVDGGGGEEGLKEPNGVRMGVSLNFSIHSNSFNDINSH